MKYGDEPLFFTSFQSFLVILEKSRPLLQDRLMNILQCNTDIIVIMKLKGPMTFTTFEHKAFKVGLWPTSKLFLFISMKAL